MCGTKNISCAEAYLSQRNTTNGQLTKPNAVHTNDIFHNAHRLGRVTELIRSPSLLEDEVSSPSAWN